jgi:hypothetical protein
MSLKQPLMTRCGHAIAYFKVEFITITHYEMIVFSQSYPSGTFCFMWLAALRQT